MRSFCKILLLVGMLLTLITSVCAAEREAPQIQVSVLEADRKTGSVALGQTHSWFLRCRFPEYADGQRYTVIQTLSANLTYESGSLSVWLRLPGGSERALSMEEHYTFTAGSVFVEGGTADRISVSLTEEGNAMLTADAELWITYRARLKEDAPMGTQILGTAQLTCVEEDGTRTVILSDKAAVSTGGFHIRLTRASGDPIPGGKFMVARAAEDNECNQEDKLVELLDTGENVIAVVYEKFRDQWGKMAYTAETNAEGEAVCFGLVYGDYYLVQTETPEGNGIPSKPVKVQVSEVSHLTLEEGWQDSSGTIADHTVRIVNTEVVMPQTGGPGTQVYTVSGLLVILCACMLLWFNREKQGNCL